MINSEQGKEIVPRSNIMKFISKSFIIYCILFAFLQGTLMSATINHIKINEIMIPVIYEKQSSLPTFNMQLVFQNSGYIKDGQKSGLCAISAMLLNEGTKELGSIKFASKLESKAISLHTSNGFETFVMELSSLKDVYKEALDLLKKLLQSPNYTNKTLEKIKTQQIGRLKRKENDYDYVAKNNLKELLFKDTPLQNPSSGKIEELSRLKISDVERFVNSSLTLNNLIIVVGGDIEFDEFKDKIESVLSILSAGEKNVLNKIKASSAKNEKIISKDTKQAYIYFGSPFNMDSSDEDTYMAKVASFILGGSGFGSRLMEEIRVKRGLAYSAYGYISINKSHAYFTGYLQTKLDNADKAQKLVKEIVQDFIKNGVTQKELDGAKKFLSGSEPLRTETLSQRLSRSFFLYYKGLPQDYPKIELDKIENIKLKDLNEFIKSHNEIIDLSFSVVTK